MQGTPTEDTPMRRFLPLNPDLALLILRLALGAALLFHGIPKLMNYGGTVGFFQSANIPIPALSAAYAILAEVGGGILLLLGIAVDLAGLLVVIDMLGAIAFVHWSKGYDMSKGGWEYPFAILCMALALALAGPGRFALGRGAYKGPERRRAA
jgi:putative oxidoreductase